MPRKRMIDPLIWEDEHFGILSDKAKILFISCISNADDDGRLSGNLSNLRALSFRFNDIKLPEVEKIRNEIMEKMKNFILYSVNGCEYIQLGKWEEYQTQRDDRRKPSKIPDVIQMSDHCQTIVSLSKDKLSKDKLSKDKLREVKLDNGYVDFEKSTLATWNLFCDTFPTISRIKEMSDKRRTLLKKRFTKDSFKDFPVIIEAIKEQDFLLGENDRKWKVSFDWLIFNDTNYLKILERKYKDESGKLSIYR